MCVYVDAGIRISAVAWEAAVQISLRVLALSLLNRGCCSKRVQLPLLLLLLLRAMQPLQVVVQNGVKKGYWFCVSHGPKAAVPWNTDGRKLRKGNN